jgi:flagellar basal-body rod modification protein FlgD
MPIGSVDGSQNSSGNTSVLGGSSQPQGTLDRDAFLKLLVAQLSHQDPLKPMEGTEFVTQLAQFTAVEQQLAQSAKLDLISLQLRGLSNNEAASLVGKQVTVRGKGTMSWDGETEPSATFTLQGPADKVTVDVIGPDGNVVDTIEAGSRGKGPVEVVWDGKTKDGGDAPNGTYTYKVNASKEGVDVDTTTEVTGIVKAVTFENGYPELILDSGVRVPVADLVSVGANPNDPTAGTGSAAGLSQVRPIAQTPISQSTVDQIRDFLSTLDSAAR